MRRRTFLATALSASALPGLSIASASRAAASPGAVPRATAALTYAWRHDQYALGAYSALPPGTSPAVRATLAAALLGGRIALAGEYCSTRYPATTTGAYESGVRAARLVLDRIGPRTAVVVGAGMAGAAAAAELARAGTEVVVLEARDRIGGRILSDHSWGVPVELGAGWIHGRTGNPVTALAESAGLGLHLTDYEDAIVRDSVTGRASAAGARAQDRMAALVARLEEQWQPVGMSVEDWLRRQGWRPGRFADYAAEVEVTQEYGLAPRDLAARATEEGADLRGPDVLVSGGYARIPERLLSGVEVRMGTAVAGIRADDTGAEVTLPSGSVLRADAVVCAVPLAVLHAGRPALEPLPAEVARALAGLRTGELQKVVLRYPERWWPDTTVIGIVGGGVPGAPPGSAAALRWTEFYDVTDVLGFPALAGFSGGSAARSMPASADAAAHEAEAMLAAGFARAARR